MKICWLSRCYTTLKSQIPSTLIYSFNCTPERPAFDDAISSSRMKFLMQIFEVFAGDVGIYLRR